MSRSLIGGNGGVSVGLVYRLCVWGAQVGCIDVITACTEPGADREYLHLFVGWLVG